MIAPVTKREKLGLPESALPRTYEAWSSLLGGFRKKRPKRQAMIVGKAEHDGAPASAGNGIFFFSSWP